MIRTGLTFGSSPLSVSRVEEMFQRADILAYSLQETRALTSELCVDTDKGSGEIVVTATWPNFATYEEWLEHPNRAGIAPDLPALVGEVGSARCYEVRQLVAKGSKGEVVRLLSNV